MTPQRRYRVSNRSAMLAALLLVLTSFAGFSSSNGNDQHYVNSASAQVNDKVTTQTSNKRKLNLSLLLIGRG